MVAIATLALSIAWLVSGATGAVAASKTTNHATYALHAKHCRADFVKRTERHRVHGREVRYVACVYVAPKRTASGPSTTAPSTSGTNAAVSEIGSGRATRRPSIDPAYVQDASNPLLVTWTYSAGVTDGTLPLGTLSLTVYQHNAVAASGGCTINVGGFVTGGTCALTLPAYGNYDVTVNYAGSSSSVASTSSTDTEDIENPNSSTPTTTTTTLPPKPVPHVGQTGPNISDGDPASFQGVDVVIAVVPTAGGPLPTGTVCAISTVGTSVCAMLVQGPVTVHGLSVGTSTEALAVLPTLSTGDTYAYSGDSYYAP
jgi:hypothetical protein